VHINLIKERIRRHPVVVTQGCLSLGTIPGINVWKDPLAFLRQWDSAAVDPAQPHAIIDPEAKLGDRFPVVTPPDQVDASELSHALFAQPQVFRSLIEVQDNIYRLVSKSSRGKDAIVLIIVDGLSFRDCQERGVRPCFAPGATITSEGYQRVAGNGKVAKALSQHKFHNRLGFTHWSRKEDEITDSIFKYFDDNSLYSIAFDDILDVIEKQICPKTYIQVVLNGLDLIAHHDRDEPLKRAYINRIFNRVSLLRSLLDRKGLRASIFLTADHGILWRGEHEFVLVNEPHWSRQDGVRYLHGHIVRDYLKPVRYGNLRRSIARYPFILRKLKSTEWGIHGGVSYEESIVPLYQVEV